MENSLGFIGFGKMANAICKGVIQAGFIKKENIFAYDINKESLLNNTNNLGITPVETIENLAGQVSNILVATKPFVINDVLFELKNSAKNKLIISILAGITTETYENALEGARIVRVMPNTPAMVNAGMSVVCGGKKSTSQDVDFVCKMFSNLGEAIILDESKINAVTGVSGSGPAFYYYLIEQIALGGEKVGLDYQTSLKLSAQTALGAAKMLLQTCNTPKDLITAVTTPGGTTAEGNKVLENSDIAEVLKQTVEKTYLKAIELGKKN